jgi:hypothetical protein
MVRVIGTWPANLKPQVCSFFYPCLRLFGSTGFSRIMDANVEEGDRWKLVVRETSFLPQALLACFDLNGSCNLYWYLLLLLSIKTACILAHFRQKML